MIRVEYIGRKAIKTDNVAGTATVWHGAGDVQEVKPEVWAKLRPYDTVWREAENSATLHRFPEDSLSDAQTGEVESDSTPPGGDTPPEAPKFVIEWDEAGETKTLVLDTMDAEAIHAFLDSKGLKVPKTIKKLDTLREAAFKAATGA